MATGENRIDIFVSELLSGKTQRQSYYTAYPHSKNWKEKTVDSKASTFMATEKVRKRYNELLDKVKNKAIITREELLTGLVTGFNMAMGKEDMALIVTVDGEEKENKKIKAVDLKALKGIAETIAKMQGYIIEKIEHSGEMGVTIINDIPKND